MLKVYFLYNEIALEENIAKCRQNFFGTSKEINVTKIQNSKFGGNVKSQAAERKGKSI